MTPDSAHLRDFATRYAAAWCSQNPESVAAFYAPSASLTINSGTPAIGRAAITESARAFMSTFPDMVVVFDELAIASPSVEFHWTLTGTNTGPGGTGHRVHISGLESWQFGSDGLIAKSLGHFDAEEFQHQLDHGTGSTRS
jgi:uncharacterized protein (TIGR02246 family)